ncbi:DoxX family protein [Usitatibacter palustris]|uniref:Inner membrane protein YqjF n=1 Tax=Usitatibacter palustris TaxID=2732487 RepID=A0A6M4H961_9PROT|nr:DoxX family protein [Usitatibacter palustris]QJR16116.1 Inner membrane protein YqjF [Usitatibacter palustris]
MNNPTLTNFAALVGRSLLALLFIVSGFGKITGFAATAGYMTSKGMPFAEVLLVGAIVVELLGGLLLVAGFKARWAALAIFLFLIPTTLIFHNPAGLAAQAAQDQTIHFMKNLSIMGGMLMVVIFGPGAWSLDRK